MARKMAAIVSNRAVAIGHAGTPPITTMELIEKSKTAQSSTKPSTSMEKLRPENVNQLHATLGAVSASPNAIDSGATTIGARNTGEKVSSFSLTAENMESRPEMAADASICVSNQSRNARRT